MWISSLHTSVRLYTQPSLSSTNKSYAAIRENESEHLKTNHGFQCFTPKSVLDLKILLVLFFKKKQVYWCCAMKNIQKSHLNLSASHRRITNFALSSNRFSVFNFFVPNVWQAGLMSSTHLVLTGELLGKFSSGLAGSPMIWRAAGNRKSWSKSCINCFPAMSQISTSYLKTNNNQHLFTEKKHEENFFVHLGCIVNESCLI